MEIEQIMTMLFNYGIAGVMLYWFMTRMEKVIENNTKVLETFCVANNITTEGATVKQNGGHD